MPMCRPHQRRPAKPPSDGTAVCSNKCFKTSLPAAAVSTAVATAAAPMVTPQAPGMSVCLTQGTEGMLCHLVLFAASLSKWPVL